MHAFIRVGWLVGVLFFLFPALCMNWLTLALLNAPKKHEKQPSIYASALYDISPLSVTVILVVVAAATHPVLLAWCWCWWCAFLDL